MLYPDIKSYFIEQEFGEDEQYLQDLEDCSSINELVEIVADYYSLDIYEAAHKILEKITQ